MAQQKESVLDTPGIISMAWFIICGILLPLLPNTPHIPHIPLIVSIGILPMVAWFLIKPMRIKWLIKTLLGFNALDK
ncbi:MAG: hypothetical protein ABW116_11255 [Candidatus Sedimenticola sp. 20ELBAFRAG]